MSAKKALCLLGFVLYELLTPVVTQRVRMCYYTGWSQYRFSSSDVDVTLCTHVIYAFAHVNSMDNTIATVQYNDLELYRNVTSLKDKNPDLKVLLAIGGYNFGSAGFIAVARDVQKTSQFADNAVSFLRQHGFDGLDVDWEFPDSSTKLLYQRFIRTLWDRFQQTSTETSTGQRLLLTLGVSANHEIADSSYGPGVLSQISDYILLMTYDFWGPWISRLAHHSPLYIRPQDVDDTDLGRFSANKTVQTWISLGAARSQLVMGIATYAHTGTMYSVDQHRLGDTYTRQKGSPGRFTREYGLLSYFEVCENLQNAAKRWTSVYDTAAAVPYAYSSTWPLDWVSYDNPTSVRSKAEYVVQQNLAGAMVWSLDFDDYSGQFCNSGPYPLISQIKEVFQAQPGFVPTTAAGVRASTTRSMSTAIPQRVLSTTPGQAGVVQPATQSNPRGCLRSDLCPQMFGLFADCGNCSRFVHCSFSVPYIINCPPSLRYQASQKVCDWPQNVYCELDNL